MYWYVFVVVLLLASTLVRTSWFASYVVYTVSPRPSVVVIGSPWLRDLRSALRLFKQGDHILMLAQFSEPTRIPPFVRDIV